MNAVLKSRLGQLGLLAMFLSMAVALIAATRGPSESQKTKQDEAERTKCAITHMLQADQALHKQVEGTIPKGAPPSVVALCIEHYCDGLESLDMSDCPADFRVAYREHVRAWRELDAAIKQIPDSFVDGLFAGFFNTLEGESDGGAGRIRGDVNNASRSVEGTWNTVEQTGARYGAAL